MEYFDPSPEVQDQKYAFKCHRQMIDDVDHVWPVNALAFHPVYVPLPCPPCPIHVLHVFMSAYSHPLARYNTFASAGSDGTVSIWDHKVKKRLRQYPKYSGPIPSVAFNCDRTRLAVGVSYTWDEGEEGTKNVEKPAVWVCRMGDEVKVSECAVWWVMHGTQVRCFEASTGLESR